MRRSGAPRRPRWIALLGCAAVLAGSLVASGRSAAGAADPYDWSAVDAYLAGATGGLLQPTGASIQIIDDGAVVHTYATGTGPAADPANQIPLYSVSKWVAATVVMTLVEDGAFGLDDSVPALLPGTTFVDPRWDDVTVRMLLAHTSGLAPQLGATGLCTGVYWMTLQACVGLLALEPLVAAPGTAFAYTGVGYQVLGLVAEEATGESWQDLVHDRLTTPCEMATLHYDEGLNPPTENPWIAGGAISDLDDLGTFVELQRTGSCGSTQVLAPATLAEMRASQSAGTTSLFSPYSDGRSYGLGLFRNDYTGSSNLDLYSHAGAGGTYPWTDVDGGYSAVLFLAANQTTGASTGISMYEDLLPLVEAQVL